MHKLLIFFIVIVAIQIKPMDPDAPDFNTTIDTIVTILERLQKLEEQKDCTPLEQHEKEILLHALKNAKRHALTFSQKYKIVIHTCQNPKEDN